MSHRWLGCVVVCSMCMCVFAMQELCCVHDCLSDRRALALPALPPHLPQGLRGHVAAHTLTVPRLHEGHHIAQPRHMTIPHHCTIDQQTQFFYVYLVVYLPPHLLWSQ